MYHQDTKWLDVLNITLFCFIAKRDKIEVQQGGDGFILSPQERSQDGVQPGPHSETFCLQKSTTNNETTKE